MSDPCSLLWLHDDLRLDDHPALADAVATGRPVLFLYVHDTQTLGLRPPGGAARAWLARSLNAFDEALRAYGARLLVLEGKTLVVLRAVLEAAPIASIHWTRRHGPEEALDVVVENEAVGRGIDVRTRASRLLVAPPRRSGVGSVGGVFTPFHAAALEREENTPPLPRPETLRPGVWPDDLVARALAPARIADGVVFDPEPCWKPGEIGAHERLSAFVARSIHVYDGTRDRPDLDTTSRLSPHLRFGEISPRRLLHRIHAEADRDAGASLTRLRTQLGWRDFFHAQRVVHPRLETREVHPFPDFLSWRDDEAGFRAWCEGRTGYPLVDAGMRELAATGFMHNRVRMVAASFLVKHLMIDWRQGEAFFWERLVDADPANNPANWQWVAGCGHDALPHQRIFNPTTQAERLDPQGDYIRRFVPELSGLPAHAIHAPSAAPPLELAFAGVRLGKTYPRPIVEHERARERFLACLAGQGLK